MVGQNTTAKPPFAGGKEPKAMIYLAYPGAAALGVGPVRGHRQIEE
jgi:hypothetical protein